MGFFSAIGAVAGALIGSSSNRRAASQVSEAERERTAAIREGNAQAQKRFEVLIDQGQPGIDRLQQVTARPAHELTPAQRIGLEDTQRGVRNRLATGGLRGSGRTGAAVFNDSTARFTADAIDRNERRGDTAGRQLASLAGNAQSSAAAVDQNTGRAVGDSARRIGDVNAGATIANGELFSDSIGALSSVFARDSQQESRRGRQAGRENV